MRRLISAELRDNFSLSLLCLLLLGLSSWLQFVVLDKSQTISSLERDIPDYYVEKFTIVGKDSAGIKYQLSADKLTNYPQMERAFLDKPHILKYTDNKIPIQIYADSGWLYNNHSTVELIDNVRIIESDETTNSTTVDTDNMVIQLK